MYIFRETANFPMKIEFFFESLIQAVLQPEFMPSMMANAIYDGELSKLKIFARLLVSLIRRNSRLAFGLSRK